MSVELVVGDISAQVADAIVNAANSSLLGGGGVDGAIHRAGGPAILRECRRLRQERYPDGLPTGQAVATGAGNLQAKWVIHTVGPIYDPGVDQSALLADAYFNSLNVANDLGAHTVAFPSISTGAYSYPIDEAAHIALTTVLRHLPTTAIEEVRFVLFSAEQNQVYADTLATLST